MAATDEQTTRRRGPTAWRASHRILARTSSDGTLGEQLAALTAGAEAVYGTDKPLDHYGDGVVAEVEERVAGLLGMESAAFFPTGTMAQQVALRCWAARTGNAAVALHPLAHPELHEEGALGAVSGLRTVYPTTEPRLPTAEEIEGFAEPFGTLMLELPLRDSRLRPAVLGGADRGRGGGPGAGRGGAPGRGPPLGVPPHLGHGLAEIAGLADSVYVSFYKSLGGMSGAVLAGPRTLIEEARSWRHRYGGQLFQQYPAALSALVGLERELPRLPEYVAHAAVVAGALAEGFEASAVPWFRVRPEPPHTHQFQLWLPYSTDVLDEASLRQAEETGVTLFRRWFTGPQLPPGIAYTEVTVNAAGLEWTAQEVRDAVGDFVSRLV